MAGLGGSRTVAGAGVIGTAVLVLAFGNQAFTEWVDNHTRSGTVWGWFLRQLSWPRWAVGPHDDSTAAMRDLLANDLRATLLLVFVALILAMVARSIAGGA